MADNELEAAWECATHNARRAERAEAEVERLRRLVGAMHECSYDHPLTDEQDAHLAEVLAALRGETAHLRGGDT